MDGWKISFLLVWPIFRGDVSFRECICLLNFGERKSIFLKRMSVEQILLLIHRSISHCTLNGHRMKKPKVFSNVGVIIACRCRYCKLCQLQCTMEPKNHLVEMENHLPNLHFCVPC